MIELLSMLNSGSCRFSLSTALPTAVGLPHRFAETVRHERDPVSEGYDCWEYDQTTAFTLECVQDIDKATTNHA
jgi:hypothetical protein